jgi:hypothetical protein
MIQKVMRSTKQSRLEEVKEIVCSMPKDKIPGPDGWTQELFQTFFEIMGEDLHKAVEESRCSGLYQEHSMLPSSLLFPR